VLDAGDAADLIDFVRQESGHAAGRRRFPRASTMLDIYSRSVNAQSPLADVLAESFPWCAEHRDPLAGIFRAYVARKRSAGLLDLDDLLLYWRALAADDVVGPRLAGASITCSSTSTGRERPPGRHRPAHAPRASRPDGRRR